MAEGLNVSRVVDVDVTFAPQAAPAGRFDTLLVLGDSDVILAGEKMRAYNAIEEVAADFQTTAPEFLAAEVYFAQTPQPETLYIARWARSATAGVLVGGALSSDERQMANWTTITNGSFSIAIDGGPATSVSGLNFSSETNLNGVAAKIDTALTGGTVVWDANRYAFVIKSGTTGVTSTVSFASPVMPPSGTDISGQLKLTAATATTAGPGAAPEDPLDAVTRVDGLGWYGLVFAAATMPDDADLMAVAAYIEATSEKHVFGVTTGDPAVLDNADTTDIASQLSLGDYMRTMVQYSTTHPYAAASVLGRAFSTNFEGSATTITLKFKVEPTVIPELISATQADTLAAKRANVFVRYNNDTSIYQEGVMSGPAYFDEIHGIDWLANRIQNDMWNLLYSAPKIPQTNAGMNMLTTAVSQGLTQALRNGMVAPGFWRAPGFGNIYDGSYLDTGYYVHAGNIEDQSQADREQRVSPLLQVAVKLAGAVHFANCVISVNRVLLGLLGGSAVLQVLLGGGLV